MKNAKLNASAAHSDGQPANNGIDQGAADANNTSREPDDGEFTRPRWPLEAAHAYCLWCCNGKASEVALCPAHRCPLWLLRSGHRPTAVEVEQNAEVTLHPSEQPITVGQLHGAPGAVLKAMRRRCIDCSGGSLAEVRSCTCDTCPLHPFRMGKNPNMHLSPERKAELLARLQH